MELRNAIGAVLMAATLAAADAATAQSMLTQSVSSHAFAETVRRIEQGIASRGLVTFAKVDHAAAAKDAGLSLRPTVLLIFGNPKSGTPIMQARPTAAIDLPLKALIWQADDGKVMVAVNDAGLYKRHGLSDEQAKPLAAVAGLVEAALK